MTRMRLDSEGRRRAIVEATMPLFARKGFAGTTTKEIARAAGISEALVFQHFPSKAALYQEILRQGCEGDPELGCLATLPASTETLVHMTRKMLDYFVLGAVDPGNETRHRLMLSSFLDDGEYARLVQAWVAERVHPLVHACLAAAASAGDLRAEVRISRNDLWFSQHVAAMIAYTRLAGPDVVSYAGGIEGLLDDAARFILRGHGLSEAAIQRWLGPIAATDPTPQAAAA